MLPKCGSVAAAPSNCPTMSEIRGCIGPNALTQFLPLLERAGGEALRNRLLAQAGITRLPAMSGLIPEQPVARLHQVMRLELPELTPSLFRQAGTHTAEYILENRIPKRVQFILRHLPSTLSGPLLLRAIANNAWTFAGSGRFEVVSWRQLTFGIHNNPITRGETADAAVCHWHEAVFEGLFRSLIDPQLSVSETTCCAAGATACLFEVR